MTAFPNPMWPQMPQLPRLPQLPQWPGMQPMQAAPQQAPEEMPNVDPGMLAQAGQAGMGLVQWLGEAESKPSRALWGTINGLTGGESGGGLANLIPFSDTMGLTDPTKGVQASDVLARAGGMIPAPENAFASPGDFMQGVGHWTEKLGADILGDPLTWVGGFGLTNKALEAQKAIQAGIKGAGMADVAPMMEAGKLASSMLWHNPQQLAEQVAEGTRYGIAFRNPFTGTVYGQLGAGSKGLAGAISKSAYDFLPSRWARGMFSGSAGFGQTGYDFSKIAQLTADRAFSANRAMSEQMAVASKVFREGHAALTAEIAEAAKAAGAAADPIAYREYIRRVTTMGMGESGKEMPTAEEVAAAAQRILKLPEGTSAEVNTKIAAMAEHTMGFHKAMLDMMDVATARVKELGGTPPQLQDIYARWFPRESSSAREGSLVQKVKDKLFGQPGAESNYDPYHVRNDVLRNTPEAELTHNTIATDGNGPSATMNLHLGKEFITPASGLEEVNGLRPGMVVKAADRNNYGRVVSLDSDVAHVHFVSPDGVHATVPLEHNLLTPITKAPKDVNLSDAAKDAQCVWADMSEGKWRTELQGVLESKETDLKKLQEAYTNSTVIEPALKREWLNPDGTVKPPRTLPGIEKGDPDRVFSYESELERWGCKQQAAETGTLPIARAPLPSETAAENVARQMAPKAAETGPNATRQLLDLLGSMSKKEGGQHLLNAGLFDRSVVSDGFDYVRYMLLKESNLRQAHSFLNTPGVLLAKDVAEESGTGVPLKQAWTGAELDAKGLDQWVKDYHPEIKPEEMKDFIENAKVAPAAANVLTAHGYLDQPKNQNAMIKFIDSLRSGYSSALYAAWPASWVRNMGSHTIKTWMQGKAGPLEIIGGMRDVMQGIKSGGAEGGEMIERAVQAGVLSGTQFGDILGEKAAMQYEGTQGIRKAGLLGQLYDAAKSYKNPLTAGRSMMQYENAVQRAGYFTTLVKKGYNDGEAAELVKQVFDVGNLSKFEKDVARRAVLFYSWPKQTVSYLMERLVESPGGRAAQTIRAATEASAQEQPGVYTPNFLKENQTVPVGGTPDAQRFFSTSMLPLGELNDLVFKNGLPDLGRTAQKLAARLHPLALAPLEAASGTQMATGRKISDLESPSAAVAGAMGFQPTPISAIDRLAHYSPISRLEGTLWNAARPMQGEKPIGQRVEEGLTGVLPNLVGLGHTATYDTNAYKLRDARDALQQQMLQVPGAKPWTSAYMPKSTTATPQQQAQFKAKAKLQAALTKRLAAYSKQKVSQ